MNSFKKNIKISAAFIFILFLSLSTVKAESKSSYFSNTADILRVNTEEKFIYANDEFTYFYNENTKFVNKQGTTTGFKKFKRGSKVEFTGIKIDDKMHLEKARFIEKAW